MDSGILLLFIILLALYLLIENIYGEKKWIDRFIASSITAWNPPKIDLNPFW